MKKISKVGKNDLRGFLPDEARPALEACGIDMFATARKHGFKIEVVRTYEDPRHYFGLLLIE